MNRLGEGSFEVDGQEVSIEVALSNPELLSLGRRALVHLHSLRWADPYRRLACAFPSEQFALAEEWWRVVEGWELALSIDELSWRPHVVAERTRVLSFGYAVFGEVLASGAARDLGQTLRNHAKALCTQFRQRISLVGLDKIAFSLLKSAIVSAIALQDSKELLRLCRLLEDSGALDEQGVAGTVTLQAQAPVQARFRELIDDFERAGVDVSQLRARISRAHFLFVHATSPNGDLLPRIDPSDLVNPVINQDELGWRYVSTQGAEGSPPESLNFVSTAGFIYGRSGWGETERQMAEETFYSVLFSHTSPDVRSPTAVSIGYFAGGIEWVRNLDGVVGAAEGDNEEAISSSISLFEVDERSKHESTISRYFDDAEISDFAIADDRYRPIRWVRRIIYSKRGEYLLLHDQLRSRSSASGRQVFVLGPGVEVAGAELNQIWLRKNGKHAILECVWPPDSKATIERGRGKTDREENIVSFCFEGSNTDVLTVVSEVADPQSFECAAQWLGRAEAVLRTRNSKVEEQVVLTPHASGVASPGEDATSALARIVRRAEFGSSEHVNDLARRLRVREVTMTLKERVWRQGASIAARSEAISALIQFASEQHLDGSRDHGLGAALVDLAGRDLRASVADHELVGQLRRSALINWSPIPVSQEFYGWPMYTERDVPDALATLDDVRRLEPTIMTIDFGQVVLPSLVVDGPGNVLTVMFHGATDRLRNSIPRFERVRSLSDLQVGPSLFFSDPGLDLDASMILAWYGGTEDLDLHREIASYVSGFARQRDIEHVVLIGNSGGAFAALQVASHIPRSSVIAFNPQIEIDKYSPRLAKAAQVTLFGRESISDDPLIAERMNILRRYASIDFDRNVFLIQNVGDSHHFEAHYTPFVEAFNSSGAAHRLVTHTPDLGPGHRVPPPAEYNRLVGLGIQKFT